MGTIAGEDLMQWEKTQGSTADGEKILVSIRFRPLSAKEIASNEVSDWECINDNTILFRNSLPERSMLPTIYTFDRVFRSDCSTKQVYEEGAKEVAQSVVSGINSTIFAYGQTSSGKTYTMNGITEYTAADIYGYIQRHEERAFILKFSAMEIYNEAVRDLLSADSTPLRLLDDPERGTIIERLTEETLKDWNHLRELISICEAQRRIGETSLNETSSRSHQILRLTIESSAREFIGKDNSSTLTASVNFVDLAGSERASQALSVGTRLKEGCHINRSLLTLGTVIRKLSKGRNGHVPYRDSKLTRILQSSLGGNSRTAIICTLSPARSHVEQSRNTLFFASCAKEVATNAQVNVVMSDKALVKHLQREVARLESELKGPGSTSFICDSAALLREKDLKIEKMKKEIKELTEQRDLAQSQVEDLLRVFGHDQASRLLVGFPISQTQNKWEDQHSVSGTFNVVDPHCLDGSIGPFSTPCYSDGKSRTNTDKHYLQLPVCSVHHLQSDGTTPQLLDRTHEFCGPYPYHDWEKMAQGKGEEFEDLCKEVRCVEVEELCTNRNIASDALSSEENEGISALTVSGNGVATSQESMLYPLKGDRELSHVQAIYTYGAAEQKTKDMQRNFDILVNPYPDEPSSWSVPADISIPTNLKLTKSRSCRATLMTSSSPPRSERLDQIMNTPPNWFEKDFPGRPEGFRGKIPVLNYGEDPGRLSRQDSHSSIGSAFMDEPKAQNTRMSTDEEISSIHTFVAELKEMAEIQCEKKLCNNLETQPDADESGKKVKNVGLDPIQDSLDAPSDWPLIFEMLQREIIEFWHICNVSLVHRTYFFLLFRGDPTDSIYMEVELRRLTFLKNTFSHGNQAVEKGQTLSPASSMRALRREREILSKKMLKQFTLEERENIYRKWSIQLDTKKRRLQLARCLWTDTKDMDHVFESASLVAKLIGFQGSGQALKEMFGLSFTPWRSSRRFFSWR